MVEKNDLNKKVEEITKLVTLETYFKYKNVSDKAVLGKVIAKVPEIKKELKDYIPKIKKYVNNVDSLNEKEKENLLERLEKLYYNTENKKDEKSNKKDRTKKIEEKSEKKNELSELDLKDLNGKKVRTRFAPSPTGYLHIGHAYNIIYNYYYSKKYNGKFILRFEDTNPEKTEEDFYNSIIRDVNWITKDGISEVVYQSDRLNYYYDYAKKLIEIGKAYVCTCKSEVFKNYIDNKKPCPCRNLIVGEHLRRFEKMFKEYKPGEAVLRFKADLENPNPALRDFPIMRINETEHPRTGKKYRVWPLYNLSTAIDDALLNVTHIIRGKDGEINGIRQDMIKDVLNLSKSHYLHIGRVQFTDLELGKTPIKEKIEKGIYKGWDDPRVPTLVSFRKKGFLPEAFQDMIVSMGISKRDSKISFKDYLKNLIFFNKKYVDKIAERYFFINNSIKVILKNNNIKEVKLPKHPVENYGFRIFKIKDVVYLEKEDVLRFKEGSYIRLMHFANFRIEKVDIDKNEVILEYHSTELNKELKAKLIHFLPELKHKAQIVMNDSSVKEGYIETNNLEINKIYQFERFGFCRLDNIKKGKEKEFIFYFTHK